MRRFRGARNDSPGLGNRIDAAFIVGDRAKRRSIVEISAAIPVAVPGLALEGVLQGGGVLTPGRRALGVVMLIRQIGECYQRRIQEPAEPDALPLAAGADAVQTVVPVAGAHQRQAVRASCETLVERQRAMVEQTGFGAGHRRQEERIALAIFQYGPFEKRYRLVKHSEVAGDPDIVGDDKDQPAAVIGDACADTAP